MSHRLRPAIAALAIVLAGAALTACGDKGDSKPDASSTKTTSAAASGTTLTRTSFFTTVSAAQLKAGSAHMTMVIGAGGQTIKADGDVKMGKTLAENAASMTMESAAAGLGSLKMILTDGIFYLNFGKMTDNKYVKLDLKDKNNPLTAQFGQLFDQMDPSKAFQQYEAALKSFDKKGSPVQIDGVKAQPYQVVLDTSKIAAFADLPSSAAKNIPSTLTYVMYVGSDNLMRRISYDLAGSKSQVDYSKWGEPVDIKAPAAGDITDKSISQLLGGAPKSA
jgi:hypothetical protein